ncbi:hypothetical protein E2C01_005556 [Portunus trituberculatus]|uniref:Uncharacterized protein n=1 Tax=Portunus trituberculatus TaxID=210409 RepID=A0A5B7CTS9_PORTR|nr:hypothetical protein [Portunus trituberculatus]
MVGMGEEREEVEEEMIGVEVSEMEGRGEAEEKKVAKERKEKRMEYWREEETRIAVKLQRLMKMVMVVVVLIVAIGMAVDEVVCGGKAVAAGNSEVKIALLAGWWMGRQWVWGDVHHAPHLATPHHTTPHHASPHHANLALPPLPSSITLSYSILGVNSPKIFSILVNIDWPTTLEHDGVRKEKLNVSEVGLGDYVGVQVAVCGRERGWAGPATRGNAGPRPTLARLSVTQAEGGDSLPLWCSLRYSGGATLPVGFYFP